MKDKIIIFIIGILIGSIIAAGGYCIYIKTSTNDIDKFQINGRQQSQSFNGNMPDMHNGQPQMPNNSQKGV